MAVENMMGIGAEGRPQWTEWRHRSTVEKLERGQEPVSPKCLKGRSVILFLRALESH
jgi:hypothetical protein